MFFKKFSIFIQISNYIYYLFLLFIFAAGNSATEMEQGYGSGSGRINHENQGGYGSELFGGFIGGNASGSGSGGVGKEKFQNWILLCFNFFSLKSQ